MTNYHKRSEYEKLYLRLLHERDVSNMDNLEEVSDFHLLRNINRELAYQGCISMSQDEMELDLI